MKTYHVARRSDSEWVVIREKAVRASSVHPTRESAIATARKLAAKTAASVLCPDCQSGAEHEIAPSDTAASPGHLATRRSATVAERIGARVKRARLMRGFSLRELAEATSGALSHTSIQKLEKGLSDIDTELLGMISEALSVRPDYFLQKDRLRLQGVEYRKQNSKLGKKQQTMVEEQAFEFFERYVEAERILELELPDFERVDITKATSGSLGSAIERAAERLREQWQLGTNPIPNVHAMLEEHGVKVKCLEQRKGFDGFSAFAKTEDEKVLVPVIALAKTTDLPRFRFSALHELGHLYLKLPTGLEHRDIERACHRFAAAFLIPADSFKKILGERRNKFALQELIDLKARWGISIAAAIHRAKDLEVITESLHKGYCIRNRKNGWHLPGKEPGKWNGGDEESNRLQNLVLRALSQGFITPSKAAGLLDISLPELADLSEPFA